MLANTPNGKVSEALAQIYTKEGISLKQPTGGGKGKDGAAGASAGGDGADEGGEDFIPVVYVAKVRRGESSRNSSR